MKVELAMLNRILSSIFIAMLVLAFIPVPQSYAATSKSVYMVPPKYIYDTTNATIGTRFNVTVWINSTTYPWNLMMWQIWMTYDDNLINVSQVFVSNKWPVVAYPNGYLGGRNWDPQYVFYAQAGGAIGNPTYYNLAPGSGALMIGDLLMDNYAVDAAKKVCTVEFTIKQLPANPGEKLSCTIGINNDQSFFYDTAGPVADVGIQDGYYEISRPGVPPPQRTLTINSATGGTTTPPAGPHTYNNGTTVPVTAYPSSGFTFGHWTLDSQVISSNPTNVLMDADHVLTPTFTLIPTNRTRLFVDPPEIIDPTMVPSSIFNINITVDDVSDMKVCIFNLTYDTNVLGWAGIKLLRIGGQLPKANVEADDDHGFIWAKLTYTTPITTADPTPLIQITFHVENLGATILGLRDTELLDSLGNPIDHDAYDGFFMSLIRDIAVTNVVPSRTWAYQGWPVNIAITVKNLGNISETFDLNAFYDSNLIDTTTVVDLLPNTERTVIINWDTSTVGEGTYTIKGEAPLVPFELNTTNNVYIDGTVQILTVIRDVAVTNVVTEQNWAYQGWLVHVNVTAENLGEITETFNVTLFYDGNTIGMYTVVNLAPHTALLIDFAWNTSTAQACHNYTLTAEASEIPYEFDTTNNIYVDGKVKIYLLGDVNGDGIVNMLDLYQEGLAFGYSRGEPGYNVYADVDRNGIVNMIDMYIVARNFGNSC